MGCGYIYEFTMCATPAEEDNYEEYIQYDATRKAIHVGDRPFGAQSGDVYTSMIDDFMRSERDNIEFLLDRYQVWKQEYDGQKKILQRPLTLVSSLCKS